MTIVYSETAKETFGRAIKRFIDNHEYWPPSLQRFWEDLPLEQKYGGQLTYSALITWMAEETGFHILVDSKKHSKFVKLLGRYIERGHRPSASAGECFPLQSAIALCGVCIKKDGTPYKGIPAIIELLSMEDDDED